jgi:hypothetical protein
VGRERSQGVPRGAALAEPFRDLLADDLLDELETSKGRAKTSGQEEPASLVAGSMMGDLVGAAGFEPATSRCEERCRGAE